MAWGKDNNDLTPKYVYLTEGIALTVFGIAAIAWPGLTFLTFTMIFGLFALASGIINVVGGILRIREGWSSIARLVLGALYVAAGGYVLNHPGMAALTLVILIAFTFIIHGIIDIVTAVSDKTDYRTLTIVAGVFGVMVGLILLRHPVGGGLAYTWVLGLYALVSGPIFIAIGLGAKSEK